MPASSVEMLRHTEEALAKLGYHTQHLIYQERHHTNSKQALEALRQKYPNTVWLLRSPTLTTLQWCYDNQIPCCIMGAQPSPPLFPGVDLDIERVVTQSIDYLKKLGHSHIFFIHPKGDTHGLTRMLQATQNLNDIHVHPLALPSDDNPRALSLIKKMLLDHPGFTACICTYFQHFIAVNSTLSAAGAKIPHDLSALCLYPDPLMDWTYGGVTHFKLDPKQAGLRMATIIKQLLSGQSLAPKSTLFFPTFKEGATCAKKTP
ncbi:substrate-binding domain-containing protein [Rubritalea tangerina]|uniref:Substrate-binding domain-containing protein n=2 Tax=Rubritalea tangerina TaxID=430798 RepID=A0ABW4ZAC1_9BACT